ncbi:MAG: cyclic nucleotide-binding domain-containing protein [Terriglobia bacterium]
MGGQAVQESYRTLPAAKGRVEMKPLPARRAPESTHAARWAAIRNCALAVFLALPVIGYLIPGIAGRAVWTVVLPVIPLFIVLAGYHRWREICPLAWFSQLAARLGRPGERRGAAWLQANYYFVAFGVFFFSLWLRLIATNGHGPALATFLLALSLAAFLYGALYTGKTWCNYICPVSFIEKIYTEPRGIRPISNSQCPKCTACKPACPDINEENGYWKEILSAPKRLVYFAFPGLVFSFYFYYYLQAGTWHYYFSGAWTNEPEVLRTALLPGYDPATAGFFFLPAMPRAAAALITLAVGALGSVILFTLAERVVGARLQRRGVGMDEAGIRHIMFTAAAFTAFIAFYSFAGAPTIRLLAGAPHLFEILVVVTATIVLARRFTRQQRAFAEETLARQIIRRWKWADVEPPKDLHEAFLIHQIRSQTLASGHARLLEIYKESVREAVASGFVSRAEVQRLESLRNQLQITQADHEKVMADLDEEERARIANPALQVSAEKRLQLDSYTRALESYLERVSQAAGAPDDSFIRHLRQEYAVTSEEHGAVLDELLGKGQGMTPHVAKALGVMEDAARTLQFLHAERTPAGDFLADALERRRARAADGLMRGFGCAPDDERNHALRDGLLSDDESAREAAVETLGASVAKAIGARLRDARRAAAQVAQTRATLAEAVGAHLESVDPYVRAAALYVLNERAGVGEETLTNLIRDEHEVVRETALCLLFRSKQLETREETGLVTLERMMALRAVPLFSSLAPEDLSSLARASLEKAFAAGEALCVEGEPGDEVFILLSGDVKVFRQIGDEQKLVGGEKAGGFIGEMAVLDPAPRAASVLAGDGGTRALCLAGGTFRDVLGANQSVTHGVIRALVARIRGPQPPPRPAATSRPR